MTLDGVRSSQVFQPYLIGICGSSRTPLSLEIYNVLEQEVRTFVEEEKVEFFIEKVRS